MQNFFKNTQINCSELLIINLALGDFEAADT
jgi:hypothetical protein